MSPRRLARSCFAALTSAFVMFPSAAAHAGPTEAELSQARERFGAARRLEDAGRWGEALTLLQRVAEVKTTPQVRFHIALCMENVGLWTQALDAFTQAAGEGLGVAPDVVKEANEHIRKLEAQIPTVSLHVTGASVGDELLLDRRPVPIEPHPLPLRADPGPHSAEVRRGAAVIARELFTLEPRAGRRVELHVGDVAPAPAKVDQPPPDAAPKPEPKPEPSPQAPPEGRTQRILGWTAIGVAGASAIATGVFIGLRADAKGRLDEQCPSYTDCRADVEPIVSEGKMDAALVNVFGVVSGLAATAGVVLLVTAPTPTPRASAASPPVSFSLAPAVGAGTLGLSMQGRF